MGRGPLLWHLSRGRKGTPLNGAEKEGGSPPHRGINLIDQSGGKRGGSTVSHKYSVSVCQKSERVDLFMQKGCSQNINGDK